MKESNFRSRLRRLAAEHYRGPSTFVHWTMAMDGRATGWLDDLHHARLREILVHSLGRYRLLCPGYTLMPDHGHFLFIGYSKESDQIAAVTMIRRQWNRLLRPRCQLQTQARDDVLREKDREREAFQSVAWYIANNPVRAGLVNEQGDYRYWGAIVPGCPDLHPRKPSFWDTFWRRHEERFEG